MGNYVSMKTFYLSATAAILFLGCTSCSEDSTTNDLMSNYTTVITESDVSTKRTLIEAEEEALRFISSMDSLNSPSRSNKISVKDSYIYKSKTSRSFSNDTIFYIVNTEPSGFAIIKADKSIKQPIFAYSITSEISEQSNPAFEWYMDMAQLWLKDNSIQNTSRAKQPQTGAEDLSSEYYMGVLCYRKVTQTTKSNTSELLTTKWNQPYDPYNRYCFIDGSNTTKAVAGCVAVALAQILAYHKYPNELSNHYFDWVSMTSYPDARFLSEIDKDGVGHLLRDIGSLVNMKYGVTSSAPKSDSWGALIPNTFKILGYTCSDLVLFNDALISQSLHVITKAPVYVQAINQNGDDGHAWILDGDNVTHHTFDYIGVDDGIKYGSGNYTSGWYHFNWGWGGYQDGYYEIGPAIKVLDYSPLYIVANIRPNNI